MQSGRGSFEQGLGKTGILLSIALIAILSFSLVPLVAFAKNAIAGAGHAASLVSAGSISVPVLVRSLQFTLLQALASTALAIGIGLPGAWLAARFRFPGRRALLALAAVPFCFPPILVILAFILYYGKEGYFSAFLALILGRKSEYRGLLYSFWGLVLVHAFYNFPIAVHQISALWMRIPESQKEAAKTLGAGKIMAFRTGTLPWLLPGIAQAAGLIFLYCFFSFTTVLVFGGRTGSTLEVSIYQALRYQGNARLALLFSVIETGFALLSIWFITGMTQKQQHALRDFGRRRVLSSPKGVQRAVLAIYGILLLLFFIGPLVSIVVEAFRVPASLGGGFRFGLGNFERLLRGFQAPLLKAVLATLTLSGSAALLATTAGVIAGVSVFTGKKAARPHFTNRIMEALQWLPLAVSPAVFAYGWLFLSPDRTIAAAIIAAQAVIAWPFVSRAVSASLQSLDPRLREAGRTLGAGPLQAFLTIDFRVIAPSVAASAAFAFSITAGDVNVPLMLGMSEIETLPLLLFRLTAAYRFNEACAAGLVLGLMTGIVFFLKEKAIDVA